MVCNVSAQSNTFIVPHDLFNRLTSIRLEFYSFFSAAAAAALPQSDIEIVMCVQCAHHRCSKQYDRARENEKQVAGDALQWKMAQTHTECRRLSERLK